MKSLNGVLRTAAVTATLAVGALPARAASDIVDTAMSTGMHNTLVAAVKHAGLVETLKGKGPFTVFAPTDDAFAKLPRGTLDNLMKPENKDKLVAILTYHVLPTKVWSKDITGKTMSAKTVEGTEVKVNGTMGVRVDDAKVVKADVDATNGVIHVIDKVIMPPM